MISVGNMVAATKVVGSCVLTGAANVELIIRVIGLVMVVAAGIGVIVVVIVAGSGATVMIVVVIVVVVVVVAATVADVAASASVGLRGVVQIHVWR